MDNIEVNVARPLKKSADLPIHCRNILTQYRSNEPADIVIASSDRSKLYVRNSLRLVY